MFIKLSYSFIVFIIGILAEHYYAVLSTYFSKINFSMKDMDEKFAQIINDNVPKRVELQLPKLNKIGENGLPKLKLPKLKKLELEK